MKKISHFVCAAIIGLTAISSQAAVTKVTLNQGSEFSAEQKINKNSGDEWIYNSISFKVTDQSPILFSFFTEQKANNVGKGTFDWLSVKLLEGSKVISTQFFGTTGQFLFSNTFSANKNYKFQFNGISSNYTGNLNYTVTAVPEPATYALMGLGLIGLLTARRRRIKTA
ncbi:FxDxF family PEP-CTERM protein [uncultured Deefgea sp.]|uniref:FxDxF family PEP-CTERM protein n=1 Tax=uncultured Deefgea sp. TaxID=1304914 RepID=UPI002596F85A|nr:FxDxF family PEP-CTERM protein [uncultured Deefgea sp.]